MAERFPGGVISKTPPTVTGPTDGEGGSASGVWSLTEVLDYEKAGAWPKPPIPRELYSWGNNYNGQLGQNNRTYRSSPVQVGASTDWTQVSAGTRQSAAIKTDGTLWTWGDNPSGQLGSNSVLDRSSPVQVGSLTNWKQVSVGGYITGYSSNSAMLAVKTDGTLWGWGANLRGQLGDNTNINRSSPVQIGALTDWYQVSGSIVHSAAVKSDNTLWTWGQNNTGQLGLNDIVWRSSPTQVGALTDWSYVSTRSQADFAVAVKTDGTLWSWGRNDNGQLGINLSTGYRSSPVQIGASSDWLTVATGDRPFAVAVKTNGTIWAWGYNGEGQVGDGTVIRRSSPVQIGALTNWEKVSAGRQFAVAVKTDGTLWSWGGGSSGRLGDGTVVSRSSPVQVGSETNWYQASAGFVHTMAVTRG